MHPSRGNDVNPHLDFLLSSVFDDSDLHPQHSADLRKSGLTDETICLHKIRSVPPAMIDLLLGFHAPRVKHAYLIPFPDPAGGWRDYVKLKTFGDDETTEVRGTEIEEHRERWRYNGGKRKYLVRRRSAPHLYFPIPTMLRVLKGREPLWLVEGMKKALAIAQLDLPALGLESAWGWRLKGSPDLLPDFDAVALFGRVVNIVPDPDAHTVPQIALAMHRLAEAVEQRGARVQIVKLPLEATIA
jgi:hypothetical protein